ncbi:hypothetical protein ASE01_13315 [Nocardioides sp. Root190]|uniref:hypothetical protein n=1 Tax=Nocardioides sp. Root190 TaxID=1736488 RepID=UPI0006FAE642|nr:hypothetical protein [Nocardioides sp. Root190]KRB76014.1 hypothetical protein ASE01_13315 [Nocardioides sp. Root190]
MSVRRAFLSSLVVVVAGSVLTGVTAPAGADVDPVVLQGALDLPAGVTATVTGSAAVATQAFNDFPSRGSQYLLLSTGNVSQVLLASPLAIDDPATVGDERDPDPDALSTDRGADGVPDMTRLSLSVDPSTNAGCLYIDFAMATDETVRPAVTGTVSDRISVTRRADTEEPAAEYAMNAGRGYFQQEGWPSQPRPYSVNDVDYWQEPGSRSDVLGGQLETPRLERWTRLNHVTTRDTVRVPLNFSNGAEIIDFDVADAPNDAGEIDTAAFVDNVRLSANCSNGTAAQPSQPYGDGSIEGERRVGYPLSYDPFPATAAIERYDAADNGWTYPGKVTPVDLRFRWYRTKQICPTGGYYSGDMNNWTPIPDADRQSYVPTNLDYKRCLIVMVSGVVDGRPTGTFPNTLEAGTAPEKWYVTLPIDNGVFQDGSTPTVNHDGSPKVGETITASPVRTRPLQESWTYQWYANGSTIAGATSSSLVLAAAQRSKVITVRTTAHRSAFDTRTWTSAETPAVLGDVMESTGSPSIVPQEDGEAPSVGDELTAEAGPGWPANTAFTYQWKRAGTSIAGADQPIYKTVTGDAGKLLTVTVTGSKPGFDPVFATSPAVTVNGAFMDGALPTITGKVKVGEILTGAAAGWLPSYSTLTYAWYTGDTLLKTGSSRTFTITSALVGRSIQLRVTGAKSGYASRTRVSTPTSAVARGTLVPATPRISGTLRVGQTLRAVTGLWRPSGVTYKYQWRVGTTMLSGTTRTSIKLGSSARGKRVTLWITGSKSGYTTVKKSVISGTVR